MLPFLAPLLAQGLNLVANAALVKGKEKIEEAVGVKLDGSPLSEDDTIKLHQYQAANESELLQYRLEQNKLDVEAEKLRLADVQNARDMQRQAMQSEDRFVRWFIYLFAGFWSILSAAYIGFITFGTIPETNVRFADTILGFVLGTLIATIIQFFYGSSKGSHDKTAQLAKRGDE